MKVLERDQTMEKQNETPVSMPNEFRCPLSLKLMKDPVTISTGSLLTKLKASSPNVQQIAAAEIRRLAKINDDYRVEIAFDEHKERFEIVRAIPPLVRLLSEGSLHGKKDVASALHKSESGMKDEALVLLDTLEPPGSEGVNQFVSLQVILESGGEYLELGNKTYQ
ncbi:U-box domain-containing protein 14 [Tanacetum coccineum]